ncbi:hypothetical protein LNQ03_03375 [Klebsiella pneumoniae subsp. pneumoniae]|nr:hypothetical protein [Klebsiella pneumoniae subsp. pneumoniae]
MAIRVQRLHILKIKVCATIGVRSAQSKPPITAHPGLAKCFRWRRPRSSGVIIEDLQWNGHANDHH